MVQIGALNSVSQPAKHAFFDAAVSRTRTLYSYDSPDCKWGRDRVSQDASSVKYNEEVEEGKWVVGRRVEGKVGGSGGPDVTVANEIRSVALVLNGLCKGQVLF